MPVIFKEKHYKTIQTELETYFYDFYWSDILKAVKQSERLYNSNSALIAAIRKGSIQYIQGIFTGKFNVRISKELSKFAKYDRRSKIWKGIPPSNVTAAAAVANSRGEKLAAELNNIIAKIPERVDAAIEQLHYSIDAPLFMMSEEAGKDLITLGISVDMTPELSQRLSDNYTTNMNLNIRNEGGPGDWTSKQVIRLREMIEQNALSGYNRQELQQLIANEYGISMQKAKFLARNETALFTSHLRDARYQEAGITRYKWSSSQDIRVRELHEELNGRIFSYSSPPIIDEKTGQRGNPGETYNCRCVAIPIL